ncbi:MAG: YbhB/YbcL family Raf kinase inhibitor-like protein [Intestinibacter sp.]
MKNQLIITSPSFVDGENIPKKHTGFAEDISPEFVLENLCDETKSIAIIMDDLDVPMMRELNHWIIWNIPKLNVIPENIPYGEKIDTLNGAIQGIAYGKNKYRGPKIPFFLKCPHRYVFQIYALDTILDLPPHAKKKDLKEAMEGHILHEGSIMGIYKRGE